MSVPADIPEEVGEDLGRLRRIMDRICGSGDPMAVHIGLMAVDAIFLKEPRLRQMTQLVEAFDSLSPLKEELRAHALAQAVRGIASPQRSASLPHGPDGIWVGSLRLRSNPDSFEFTSPPRASHLDYLSPASFLSRMSSEAEETAITSPSAAMSSAPLEPAARKRWRLRRKRCPPRLESQSSPQQLAEMSQNGARFAPSEPGSLKTINLEGTDS